MDHKELDVWKLSMDLVEEIYKITKSFPDEEKFGIISQMRRAAVSIPSNIAEGAARKSDKEFIQFLYNALGSLSELETQFQIAIRLDFTQSNKSGGSIENCRRLILGLIRHLKNKR
jgi:four helix bundle protein